MTTKTKYQLVCKDTDEILFEGWFDSIRSCVERALEDKVCLNGVDLAGANLSNANLDDAQMVGANLSGANLNGANLSEGVFDNANFTDADLSNACLVQGSFMNTNFYGASFSSTDVTDAVITGCQFSCPSVFSTLFGRAALFLGCHYIHSGGDHFFMDRPPVTVYGLVRDIVFLDDVIKVGHDFIMKRDILSVGVHHLKLMYGNDIARYLSPIFHEKINIV